MWQYYTLAGTYGNCSNNTIFWHAKRQQKWMKKKVGIWPRASDWQWKSIKKKIYVFISIYIHLYTYIHAINIKRKLWPKIFVYIIIYERMYMYILYVYVIMGNAMLQAAR